jgi:tRNA(Ile)-lysidine synthase
VLTSIQQKVRRTIRRHALCPPGTRLLVGLSGGSDSVALTFLLRELAPHLQFEVAGVAHVNHHLRDSADRDERFCVDLAARVGLPILVGHADVKRLSATHGHSIEDAARRARYEFLDQAATQLGATRVAVGHTLDDQAETFLLKLLRGAGATGLGAIYPVRDHLIRPLLEVTRDELREYLQSIGEAWVEDETNADVSNPRNRLRHDVLPHLEAALGLPARRAMARAAGLLGEDARWLDQLAADKLDGISEETTSGLELDADQLRSAPLPLVRRVLLRALRSRANGREVGLEHVQTAVDVLTGLSGGAEVPGARVELRGKKLVLIQ